jgi:AmpD protein
LFGSPVVELRLDALGWADLAQRIPSPNCDERPAGQDIELIVIHSISLPPGQFGGPAVAQLFTNTLDRRDPYYRTLRLRCPRIFIRREGQLIQFVPCVLRAWHAGVSSWQGRERCNDFSIGIELEGCEKVAYADQQYAACNALIRSLRRAYPVRAIVGHSDIAPDRKIDPGPHFDWRRIV